MITSKLLFLAKKARETIRDLDPEDDLITYRLRMRAKEMMVVTPEDSMQVIAIQKVNPLSSSIMQETENEFNDNFNFRVDPM